MNTVPLQLFGSNSNRNQFYKSVWKFVNLGRYEKFYLGELMHKVKVSHPNDILPDN